MKKEFLFVLGLAGTLMAHADDYPYLTFLDTNGTEQSVVATGLVITFSDGQMNATDNNGKVTTISLSDLKQERRKKLKIQKWKSSHWQAIRSASTKTYDKPRLPCRKVSM